MNCVLEPGQVIYIPDDYYHQTCSLAHLNVGVAYLGSLDRLPHLAMAAVIDDHSGAAEAMQSTSALLMLGAKSQIRNTKEIKKHAMHEPNLYCSMFRMMRNYDMP